MVDLDATIDRRLRRFMGDAAAYAWLATQQAGAHAGLTDERTIPRTGLIMGSGGGSPENQIAAADVLRERAASAALDRIRSPAA